MQLPGEEGRLDGLLGIRRIEDVRHLYEMPAQEALITEMDEGCAWVAGEIARGIVEDGGRPPHAR